MTGNSRVLTDTNILIDLMKGDTGIASKLELFDDVYISPFILAELYFGAYRPLNPTKHLQKIALAVQKTKLLAVDAATSEIFVTLKLSLFSKGTPIPENDIWIAATAIQYNIPVIQTTAISDSSKNLLLFN